MRHGPDHPQLGTTTDHQGKTRSIIESPRRSPSPAVNAATGPAGNEQQASSLHPSVRRDGRTATPSLTLAGSSSHARRAPMDAKNDGMWDNGRKIPAHPYLARQMSDFGFRQNP